MSMISEWTREQESEYLRAYLQITGGGNWDRYWKGNCGVSVILLD